MSNRSYFFNWQSRLEAKKYFYSFWVWWGIYAILFYILLLAFLFTKPYGVKVFFAAGTSLVLGRVIIAELIYFFYKKQRPFQNLKLIEPKFWLFSSRSNRENSFPSGHSVSSAAVSAAILCYDIPLGVFALVVALMVGMGRVVLGYHYFTDIFAGWVLGFACALLTVNYLLPMLFT